MANKITNIPVLGGTIKLIYPGIFVTKEGNNVQFQKSVKIFESERKNDAPPASLRISTIKELIKLFTENEEAIAFIE